jgi:hypothetical protein
VFIAAVFVTTVQSLYLNTRDFQYRPSPWMIYVSYAASILLVTLFALACGRVVAPRAEVNMKSLILFSDKVAVKLRRARKTPTAEESIPLPSQSIPPTPKSVKAFLILVVSISAVTMLLLGGGRWYLSLFVLTPALAIVILVEYSRRKDGRHSKASLEAENSALQ